MIPFHFEGGGEGYFGDDERVGEAGEDHGRGGFVGAGGFAGDACVGRGAEGEVVEVVREFESGREVVRRE